ncbi:MAG: hypothetical protein JOZ78_02225 [Chroococcidiopsidaceae cyanobacterium CP_BM_ER_R8_30]|nr:hypothetical protein [Chroococcidiopsidaceae cyanobacterium CP_BM_ER_R8_30]
MSNYTPQELNVIAEAPVLTGLAVSLVDLGIVSAVTEAAALSTQLVGAAKKYPNNTIIQSVFSEAAFKSGAAKLQKPEINSEEVQSGAIVDRAIASINAALTMLQGKAASEEIQEYKAFIYTIAEAVANAAGSGLFGSGAKVSDKEAAALAKLKAALAV